MKQLTLSFLFTIIASFGFSQNYKTTNMPVKFGSGIQVDDSLHIDSEALTGSGKFLYIADTSSSTRYRVSRYDFDVTDSSHWTLAYGILSPDAAYGVAWKPVTIANATADLDLTGGNVGIISSGDQANQAIATISGVSAGQIIILTAAASQTNPATIADSAPFYLSAAFTFNDDDVLVLYCVSALKFIEISRSDN